LQTGRRHNNCARGTEYLQWRPGEMASCRNGVLENVFDQRHSGRRCRDSCLRAALNGRRYSELPRCNIRAANDRILIQINSLQSPNLAYKIPELRGSEIIPTVLAAPCTRASKGRIGTWTPD